MRGTVATIGGRRFDGEVRASGPRIGAIGRRREPLVRRFDGCERLFVTGQAAFDLVAKAKAGRQRPLE